MHTLLPAFARGRDSATAAGSLFGGAGSFGNGAAMRVAPVGAYFADDLGAVVREAEKSAVVTHIHAEGVAGAGAREAALTLGNGSRVTAQDTVPFSVWCAADRLSSYEEALWLAVSAAADIDMVCAIVGGIVGGLCGEEGIPREWREARKRLPRWPFVDDPNAQ